ncbi:hypothetical protein QBC44DRAFT_352591 [Cladorrhinum sp. PSN332]|nr:hypothetical protein QBC44DRAFT_352591 [Cladorrhinum sp. PSN332]
MSESPSPNASGPRIGQAANQRRASTLKVRTGCVTCKTRHVKCDERKPTCFRCERAGMSCAGYVTNPEPRISRRAARSAEHLRFAEKDVIFFDLLRYSFVRDLAGYLHADYWARILLCESTQEECVQHAILAIGALSQAVFLTSQQSLPRSRRHAPGAAPQFPRDPVMNAHHRAAIRHQNRAISICLQRTRDSNDGLPARTLLTLTLLLVAYEFLQGDMETADGLMTSGIRLLQGSLTMLREKAASGTCRGGHDAELEEDMEYILPLLSVMSGQNNSPRPNHTEVPETEFPRVGQASTAKFISMWGDFHSRCTTFISQAMQRTVGTNAATPDGSLSHAQLQQEQTRLFSLLRQWQGIIAEYHATVRPEDSRTHKALRLINLQYHSNLICLAWSVDITETACDWFEPEFRRIVHISNEFLGDPESLLSTTAFIYTRGSVAGPLMLAATKCRSREIRLNALKAMRNMAWGNREWDAKVLVCLMGLLLLEEAGRDERGRIEAENRWRWTGAHQELDTRTVIGEYTKVVSDDRGQGVRRHLVLNIDRWMPANNETDDMLLDIGALELAAGKLDCELPGQGSSWYGLADYDGLE